MSNDKKKDRLLVNKLNSADTSIVFDALKKIKESSNINIIPHLFDLINEDTQSIIKRDVLQVICDIKDRDAVPILINEISTKDFGNDTSEVIATFWQSRLDFSKYLTTFIKIFLKENYQTSLEAFTVVEESLCRIDRDIQQECIHILQSNVKNVTNDKLPLYNEMLVLLESVTF